MKLSTRGRYGLRMLTDISIQEKEIVTLKSTALRQGVSVHYLEQVAKDLKRAGYIRSTKGPQGGYSMAKKSKDIVVGDVLRLLEGDLQLLDDSFKQESLLELSVRQKVYEPLSKTMADLFDSVTLKDILEDNKVL